MGYTINLYKKNYNINSRSQSKIAPKISYSNLYVAIYKFKEIYIQNKKEKSSDPWNATHLLEKNMYIILKLYFTE